VGHSIRFFFPSLQPTHLHADSTNNSQNTCFPKQSVDLDHQIFLFQNVGGTTNDKLQIEERVVAIGKERPIKAVGIVTIYLFWRRPIKILERKALGAIHFDELCDLLLRSDEVTGSRIHNGELIGCRGLHALAADLDHVQGQTPIIGFHPGGRGTLIGVVVFHNDLVGIGHPLYGMPLETSDVVFLIHAPQHQLGGCLW
jgi:hypothetical protein